MLKTSDKNKLNKVIGYMSKTNNNLISQFNDLLPYLRSSESLEEFLENAYEEIAYHVSYKGEEPLEYIVEDFAESIWTKYVDSKIPF